MKVPNRLITEELITQALSQVDNTLGTVLLPSRFRSTKHFTVNTPLGATLSYNIVETNRNYIIIDDINGFLNSEYAYSIDYRDAYLDVSHESLPISQNAIVLINDEKYEKIISDKNIADELSQRRVVRFKGDEDIAVNMILTEMGVLPSTIGGMYAFYDNEMIGIIKNSIRDLAEKNGLIFGKSHGGDFKPNGAHFSYYYDKKNKDYEKTFKEFIVFLRQKFPEYVEFIPEDTLFNRYKDQRIVENIGATNLLDAINEYNELAQERGRQSLEEYIKDRQNITPEVHQQFVKTINLIKDFYEKEENYFPNDDIEKNIQIFFQGQTVSEQLDASRSVCELLQNKNQTIEEEQSITPAKAVKNALLNTSMNDVILATQAEKTKERDGGTRDEQ